MKYIVFGALLITAHWAISQISSGTLVVVNFTKDKLIVAADSRASDPSGRRPPDDYHCKISALGHKIVFTTTGATVRSPSTPTDLAWDNSEIAKTVFQATSSATARISRMADKWGEIVQGNWRTLYSRNPLAVTQAADPSKGIITVGLFAGVEDGKFVTAPVAITFSALRIEPVQVGIAELSECIGIRPVRICAIGETAIFDGFKTGTSPWKGEEIVSAPKYSKIDLETLRAIHFVHLTTIHERNNTVGGAIDALEVWTDGTIHWIRRKPNCSENQTVGRHHNFVAQ